MDSTLKRYRQSALTILFTCITALPACAPGGGPPLENYLQRLERSLDVEIRPEGEPLPALPRSRDLHIDLLPGSIDMLDLLSLHRCELNITIGKSNSSLGKLATDSQRLLLELEFLALAPACIDSLDPGNDDELIALLQQGQREKRQQLPGRIWNATLGGPEFRAFWKRPRSLGDYPSGTGNAVPDAVIHLAQLTRAWLSGDYRAGRGQLEPLLDQVRRGDGGALLAALDLQQRGLRGANPAVRTRIESPLCFGGVPSREGEIVNNVVRKFFAGEVQPWSVRLQRRRRQLMAPVEELETLLAGVSPGAYREWRARRDRLLASGIEAPRRHARSLAELLETCGLRPGAANSS